MSFTEQNACILLVESMTVVSAVFENFSTKVVDFVKCQETVEGWLQNVDMKVVNCSHN